LAQLSSLYSFQAGSSVMARSRYSLACVMLLHRVLMAQGEVSCPIEIARIWRLGLSDRAYWANTCGDVSESHTFVRVSMGVVVDYFKPTQGSTMCEMLLSNDKHEWSADGFSWQTPAYDDQSRSLGGSQHKWPKDNIEGDNRLYLSFWGGCCHASYSGSPEINQAFSMHACNVQPDPTPEPTTTTTTDKNVFIGGASRGSVIITVVVGGLAALRVLLT